MAERKGIRIPYHQDDMLQIAMFSADEFLLVVFGMVGGLWLGGILNILLCIAAGVGAAMMFRKTRLNSLDGLLLHILYRWGAPIVATRKGTKQRSFINPFINRQLP